jgi:DNA repair photolyase
LLRLVTARHRFSVHMTVTTADQRLARLLEPKAPPPAKRLEAIKQLSEAGICVGVNAMPILPGLNDSDKCLNAMARAASEAGAKFLYGNILFLTPSPMKQFMPFLEDEFPRLVKQYRKLYAHSAYLNGDYKARMTKLLAELRARYGLEGNHGEPPPAARHPQLALPFEALDGSTAARGLLTPCG